MSVDWKNLLFANWPYKLAALMLSLLLWFNVTGTERLLNLPKTTRLDIEVADSGWVAVEAPKEVTTFFTASRREMALLQPSIRKVISEVTDTIMRVELSVAEVAYDRQLNVDPVAVNPSEVEVRLEPLITRRLTVTHDVSVGVADGFINSPPIVQPETVAVRGGRSEVLSLTHLETEPIRFEDLRRAATRQVEIVLPRGLSSVVVEPDRVLVTVEVDAVGERRLTVPVSAVGAGAEGVRISPPTVAVTLRGGRAQVMALTAGDLQAVVSVTTPLDAQRTLPVEVRLPEGLRVTPSPDPARVLVSPPGGEP